MSMHFGDVVRAVARSARVHHAQAAIRAVHGRAASRWLAQQVGVARRTAQRWMSRKAPKSRSGAIIQAAIDAGGTPGIAAQRLAYAQAVNVGTVEVTYDGEPQGRRHIGTVEFIGDSANYIGQAINDLLAGDLDAAGESVSCAVISGYSPGLEGTLQISDYGDFELIE